MFNMVLIFSKVQKYWTSIGHKSIWCRDDGTRWKDLQSDHSKDDF